MNLKITDPRIAIILFSATLFGGVISSIANDPSFVGTVAFIFTIVCALVIMLVYLPIITVMLFGSKIQNKTKVVNNIGLISIALLVSAQLMRIYGLSISGFVFIFSTGLLYFNFLPSWFASQFKDSNKTGRIFNFLFGTCLGIQIFSYLCRTMHWPFAEAVGKFSLYGAFFTLLPMGIVLLFKNDNAFLKFSHKFLLGFILAYLLSSYMSYKITNKNFANNSTTFNSFEKNINLYENKNRFLYDALNNSLSKDSAFVFFKNKAVELKKESDELYKHIQELKAVLIKETDQLINLNADSVSFDKIKNKANYDTPSAVLIGQEPQHPNTGKNTAFELKIKIQAYIKNVMALLPEEAVLEFKQGVPFDFKEVETQDAEILSWENYNFWHVNLSAVYSTLTNFQANIRFMEMNALNEIFNKANASNKENIAGQLAELATKYETAKKEKEISILQKDKELNDVKIQAKDVEISSREKTITYFIFAIIAFGLLTVFVIRSNILRKKSNKELKKQKDIIVSQKEEVINQKHLIEEKHREITDSINYAERIQRSFIATKEILDENLSDYFVFFKPKDVVSGDFYWASKLNNGNFAFATADSTGHGVPGAIMSLLNITSLEKAIETLTQPSDILNSTRKTIIERLKKDGSEHGGKDGMDASLMVYDFKNNILIIAAANNPVWIVRGTETIEIKADKMPVGKHDRDSVSFTQQEIDLQKGDVVYTLTDGFPDQFGGEKGKKFMSKNLRELLASNSHLPMREQKQLLEKTFTEWVGNLEQVDDVTLIGVRV